PRTLARRLDALPVALLPQARPRLDWLNDIGCHTLADLRALPRAGLQRRSAPDLLQALDAAYGQSPELHRWIEPPPRFERRIELMEYLEHTDAVLAVARRLAEQLGGWLAARQLAVRRVLLRLDHERGRHARPPTDLELALAQPVWQAPQILNLLREKLGRLTLEAPVIAVTLLAPDTTEQPAASTTLFPEPGGTAADHARLLDLLTARLGRDQVRHACPIPDHRPEAANTWGDALEPSPRPEPLPEPLDRPFWLLDPPLPLKLAGHRPQYAGQALRLMRGPERIESGWWDPALTVRDYFVAEDAAGARYWIYRERDDEHARWHLHGLYA
ncbi:DNA polymerase Y family protein, partial [Achromobacter xylosoxidans]